MATAHCHFQVRPSGNKSSRKLNLRLQCIGLMVFFIPQLGLAYAYDGHYYLRFGLSLSTCFNWDESHLIASGDWNMDANGTTKAEMHPVKNANKIGWHAFGHQDMRFNELWLRSANEENLGRRLVKLGQFMHFLEDWEAHAGYGTRMGHARDTYRGRDPDSLGNNAAKNHRMVQSAIDHLLKTCDDLGRLSNDRNLELILLMNKVHADGLLLDLYEQSDPAWKLGTFGGVRKSMREIRPLIKKRVEEFIERELIAIPEKNIPEDFEPGTERGIPKYLAIRFDRDGRFTLDGSIREAIARWAAQSETLPDVSLSLDEARVDYRGSVGHAAGWRIHLSVVNQGAVESAAGTIEIIVSDSGDEVILAQVSETLPTLAPGETRAMRVRVSSRTIPKSGAIISAFARVGDLTSDNNDDWFMLGDAEYEQPDVPIIADIDPAATGQQTAHFLSPPQMFVIDNAVCMMVTAYTSAGDSTEELHEVVLELIGAGGGEESFEVVAPARWSAITTEFGLVGAKTFECYIPEADASRTLVLPDPQELTLVATLLQKSGEPTKKEFAVTEDSVRQLLEILP